MKKNKKRNFLLQLTRLLVLGFGKISPIKIRRTHRPSASGVVSITTETMTATTFITTFLECRLQIRILKIWWTIKNYTIGIREY